jgi:CDP-diglyceride synthetase
VSWGLITGLPAHTQRSVGWLKRSSKRAVRLLTSTFGWMRLVLWLGIFQFGDVENTHITYVFQWATTLFWFVDFNDYLMFNHIFEMSCPKKKVFPPFSAGTFLVGVGTWYFCIIIHWILMDSWAAFNWSKFPKPWEVGDNQ